MDWAILYNIRNYSIYYQISTQELTLKIALTTKVEGLTTLFWFLTYNIRKDVILRCNVK